MKNNLNILIQGPKLPLWRTFLAPALQVGVIGIGIWTGSSAMQWSGFVVLMLVLLGVLVNQSRKDLCLTPDEARKRIAEIEATQ